MDGEGKAVHDIQFSEEENDVESSVGKSREERLQMFMDTFSDEWKSSWDDSDDEVDNEGRRPMKFYDYASYELDMLESDGFDIQDYSEFSEPGILVQLYYPPEKPADEAFLAELEDCACDAIDGYNRKHGTHYGNVHVVKANSEALSPCRHYITFQATDKKNNKQTFQARVNIRFPKFEKDIQFVKEVELVRIKTAPNPIVITGPRKASHGEGECSGPRP